MPEEPTRPSLMIRLRDPKDEQAWVEFESTYRDLIVGYCRRRGLQPADAEDVRQIVMMSMSTALQRGFEYNQERGKFRGYLGRMTANAISRLHSRPKGKAVRLETEMRVITPAQDAAPLDEAWEQEWVQHHYRLAMATVRTTFDERSVRMFEKLLAGTSTAAVAEEFEISTQAVHKVKQRIRNRLKELITEKIKEEENDFGFTG